MAYFKSKFKAGELNDKKLAFKIPTEQVGKIGDMKVQANSDGDIFVEIIYGSITGGRITGGKIALGQDMVDRIEKNSNAKIPADFIIPGNL
jgi:hypothetical protein